MVKSIRGNPYTHEEHERETKANTDHKHDCEWCGQKPNRLYKYE